MTTRKTSSIATTKGARVKLAASRKAAAQPGTVRVAAIQMASGPNVPSNLSEAERLIGQALSEVRDRVEQDWRATFTEQLRQERFEALLARYTVARPDAAAVLRE